MSVHQPALARQYADRIIGLRDGQIVYDAPARDFDVAALREIYDRVSVSEVQESNNLYQREAPLWSIEHTPSDP